MKGISNTGIKKLIHFGITYWKLLVLIKQSGRNVIKVGNTFTKFHRVLKIDLILKQINKELIDR